MNNVLKSLRLVEDHAMNVVNEILDAYPDMNDCPGKLRFAVSRFLTAYHIRRLTLVSEVSANPLFPKAFEKLAETNAENDTEHALVFWLNAEELAGIYEIEIKRDKIDEFIPLLADALGIDLTHAAEVFHEMVVKVRSEKKPEQLRKLEKFLGSE